LAHSGGEILKEGLVNVQSGEWILPRDVVAKLKDLIAIPQIGATTTTKTVNITMNNTITKEADVDVVMAKMTRALNRVALL